MNGLTTFLSEEGMTVAITIGAYKLTSFVRLNVLRCRRIFETTTWGKLPILISDDKSDHSFEMEKLAEELDCDYSCSPARRSHFSGDWQAVTNAVVFARETGSEVALKLSQRVIPILPAFRTALESAMADHEVQICVPGQINRSQIARPSSKFYGKFGVLSDAIAIRANAIEPHKLIEIYRERSAPGRKPEESFAETSLGYLLAHKFPGPKTRVLPEWTNHRRGHPKIYLRKSQSSAADYRQVAAMEGMTDFEPDLREWREIEEKAYRPRADVV